MKGWAKTLYRQFRAKHIVAKIAGVRVLRALAAANNEAFFIQVGANDGRMSDPLRNTILASRWRGLAVEPVPAHYRELCENYRALGDRVRPVNAAIAKASGKASFYHLQERSGHGALPEWAQGLGSFRKDVILKHDDEIPGIEKYLVEIEVDCFSWTDFCDRYHVEDLDLVLIDTEGYDFEIVRQIDFDRHRPLVLIYEHHHFDAATDDACIGLLENKGYVLFREGLDTWAVDAGNTDTRYAKLLSSLPTWIERSPYASRCGASARQP